MGTYGRGHPDDWSEEDGMVLVTDDDGEERWIHEHELSRERELGGLDWQLDEDIPF